MQKINFHYLSKLAKAGLFTNSLEMNSLTSLDLKGKIYYLQRTSINLKKSDKNKIIHTFCIFFFGLLNFTIRKKVSSTFVLFT